MGEAGRTRSRFVVRLGEGHFLASEGSLGMMGKSRYTFGCHTICEEGLTSSWAKTGQNVAVRSRFKVVRYSELQLMSTHAAQQSLVSTHDTP